MEPITVTLVSTTTTVATATAAAVTKSPIAVSLKAELIGHLFGLPITNSLLMTWLVMVILIVFAFFSTVRSK